MNSNDWATKTLIKCLQRGYVPKNLKEKMEKVFRPVFKAKKKTTETKE